MRQQRDAWSRAVRYAKVLMPLGALAILSTLFLLSRKVDAVVDLSGYDPETLKQTLADPRFAGVTDDGTSVEISARSANPIPDKADHLSVDQISVAANLPDGSWVRTTATMAVIDLRDKLVTLNDAPEITTSTGYHITATQFEIGYGTTRFATSQTIRATGPAGLITADQLVLSDTGAADSDYKMVFTGHVHMIYEPVEP
jgi:lipopolysaccharide export system protein LptC